MEWSDFYFGVVRFIGNFFAGYCMSLLCRTYWRVLLNRPDRDIDEVRRRMADRKGIL